MSIFNKRTYTDYSELLLPNQYSNAENSKKLLDIFLSEYSLYTEELDKLFENSFDVDKATDYQLDILGKLSNIERTSPDDEVYRRDIKLKRVLDNSSGTHPEMVSFLSEVSNGSKAQAFYHYPASITFSVDGDTIDSEVANAMQEISVAGVRVHGVTDVSTGREVVFPEEGSGREDIGFFKETNEVYDQYYPNAGESYMQAGEEDSVAGNLYLPEGSEDYGIFGELYGVK